MSSALVTATRSRGGRRPLVCWLTAGAVLYSSVSVSAAQPAAETRADQLFREGLEHMQADQCPVALPRFLESHRLDPSAAALANMATCYERLGKTASAFSIYRQAAEVAALEGNAEVGGQASAAVATLAPRLRRLWILTKPGAEPITVRVNGEVVDHRTPIPLDPGRATVDVSAPGRLPWSTTVQAKDPGSTIDIAVPDLEIARVVQDKPPARRTDLRPVAVAVAGVGLAGLLTGAIYAFNARAVHENSSQYCNRQGRCTHEGVELQQRAWDRAEVATWATGIGIAASATGVGLWIVSPSGPRRTRIRLAPTVTREGRAASQGTAGLLVTGEL